MINISASIIYFKIPLSTELLIKKIKPLGAYVLGASPMSMLLIERSLNVTHVLSTSVYKFVIVIEISEERF